MKIGIIGWGSVGNAAVLGLKPHHEVYGYDIDGRGRWSDIEESEIALICVQTDGNADGTLDMSNVFDVASNLNKSNYNGLVVIKSTLQPGTMDKLESIYPNFRFVYMPEFLREKDAIEWFANPDRIVASGSDNDIDLALDCFSWVPESIPRIRMKHVEAEIGKLAHNAYIATKVTFTCEIERICRSKNANPIPVMETVWTDRRVKNSAHLTPELGGFDGKCVPKDTRALASIDLDEESMIKILNMRGERDEVSKRTKRENTTKNEKIGNKIGIIILTAMLILSPIMMLNWDLGDSDDEPIHMIWEGEELPPSGSVIFFENLNSKETHTENYQSTTCYREYGSGIESCDTTYREITFLIFTLNEDTIYAEFQDLDDAIEKCIINSCDILGQMEDNNIFYILDVR